MKRFIFLWVFFAVISVYGYSDERELFFEAEGRFRAGNYRTALDLYERLISENQISKYIPDSHFRSALCLYQLGRKDEAFKIFTKIRKRYPSTGYYELVSFWQGRIALESEDYEESVSYFDEYIRGSDSSFVEEAYLYRAMSYNALDRYADAAFSLELLIGSDDFVDDGYAAALLCSLYLKLENYDEIIAVSDDLEFDDFAPVNRNRIKLYTAEAYYMKEIFSEAEKLYIELTETGDLHFSAAWQRLFSIYKKQGKDVQLNSLLANAEKSLKNRNEILQDFRMRVGIASYNSGDLKTAKSYFLKIWDTSAPAEINGLVPLYYSKILEAEGDVDRAIDMLEIFLSESDDQRPAVLLRLGGLYTKEADWGAAERRIDNFFVDYTDEDLVTEAAYLKAYNCYKTNRWEEALNYVKLAWSSDTSGERTASLLRLESALLKKTENYSGAADKLVRYLELQPDDIDAGLDLLRIRFLMKDWDKLLDEALVFKWKDEVKRQDRPFILSGYMSGLAAIAQENYARAITELSQINRIKAEEAGLSEIYPYVLYYSGWANYRNSGYDKAVLSFNELIDVYPDAEMVSDAAYMAGWSEYLVGNYESSSRFFLKHSQYSEQGEQGRFMYAKNLEALKHYREAVEIFSDLSLQSDSAFADDALFEKAAIYALMGDYEQASRDYEYLHRKYPGKLAEEGFFRRAELYYAAEDYNKASAAFYDFRRDYPGSSMYDAALYWGGMSLYEEGEDYGAALLWENLIDEYKLSIFRAPAMLKTAEVYHEADDYSASLEMYERCRLEYPGTERASEAVNQSEKLRLLLAGLSEQEAELNVIITREGGAGSPEGRRAMVELSALYISMGGSDLKPALSMLEQVVEHFEEDPESSANAQYYIGEYYFRQHDYEKATGAFVKAAGINPADRDSSAKYIYRAAETAMAAGSPVDAAELVERLSRFYPDSEWALEAEKLLKEAE